MYVALTVAALTFIYPFIWMIGASLAPMNEVGMHSTEVGAPMNKVGTPMNEVGTHRTEVGTPMNKVGTPMTEVGMHKTDGKRRQNLQKMRRRKFFSYRY